jgi:hypothetical protein
MKQTGEEAVVADLKVSCILAEIAEGKHEDL